MYSFDLLTKFKLKYKPSGLIIDTNLLIFLFVARYNSDLITRCEALNNSNKYYCKDDILKLDKIIGLFSNKIIVTPQVIAEVSNLSITKTFRGDSLSEYFVKVVQELKQAVEHYQKIDCLWNTDIEVIKKFGFTDLTMLNFSVETSTPILTDDLKLVKYGESKNAPMIYFDYFKNSAYQGALISN